MFAQRGAGFVNQALALAVAGAARAAEPAVPPPG